MLKRINMTGGSPHPLMAILIGVNVILGVSLARDAVGMQTAKILISQAPFKGFITPLTKQDAEALGEGAMK